MLCFETGPAQYIAESFGYGCSAVDLPKVLPLLGCADVKHTWVIQLGGMVARVYDQSVGGVVLFEARLVALKLVKCCRPGEN